MLKIKLGPPLDDIMRAFMKTVRTPSDPGTICFPTCNSNGAVEGSIEIVIVGINRLPGEKGGIIISGLRKNKSSIRDGKLNLQYEIPITIIYKITTNEGNQVEPVVLPTV